MWVGDAPDRAELEELLGGDREAIEVVFEASIAEVVERHVRDERLRTALHGQGIIGTYAGPRDPGTAAIHLMHASGTLEGMPGAWGYVDGGMGRVSFALADAAIEAGAVMAAGVPVAAVLPGEGVRAGGRARLIRAGVVVSNADPKRTLALCERASPTPSGAGSRRGGSTARCSRSTAGCPGCPLSRGRPGRRAAPGHGDHLHRHRRHPGRLRGQPPGRPAPAWCELYFHTAYDPSVAPAGGHVMSVFAQYVPYGLASGTGRASGGDRRPRHRRHRPLRP